MAKLSTIIVKTILSLTASAILVPIMSTKASAIGLAGALTAANDVISIANGLSSNGSGNYGSCNNSQSETNFGRPSLTITVSCTFNFIKGNWFGFGNAGKWGWERFYQMYNWRGQPGKKYSLTQTLFGSVSSYTAVTASGQANSRSYLYDGYNRKQVGANADSYFIGNRSDYKSFNEQISWSTNSLSDGTLYLGAYILGYAYANGVGSMYASSSISFTSKATITDMGSSITNWNYSGGGAGFSNSSSSYDDSSELYTENNPSLTPPEDVPVPEPVTIVGFALGGAMLLGGKGSRFGKRVSRNTEKVVDTTAIEV
jgi:hypothetical protein